MCFVKTVTFTFVLLFAQVTDEQSGRFSSTTYKFVEFCVFWSGDDPEVVEAWNSYKSLCKEVNAGTKSIEDAEREFSFNRQNIFLPLQEQIKAAGPILRNIKVFAFILSKVTRISRASSMYWVIWMLEAALFFVLGVILLCVAWLIDRFTSAVSLPDSLRGIVFVVFVLHLISFLILLAGGLVPFLHVIAIIAAILASLAGIVIGVLKLQS